MSRIWAVARHMIAESIRTKVAVLFIVIVLAILVTTPLIVTGDGLTIKSRVQNYLSYSLGSIGALLSLLTIFISCGALSSEIEQKQVFMVVSKPIPRWEFFMGKWLGVVTLNAVILLIALVATLLGTWYLKTRPTTVPGDAKALAEEVLTVRHNFKLYQPDWVKVAQDRIRQLRENNALDFDKLTPDAEAELTVQLATEAKNSWRTLPPRLWRRFEFRDLMVDKQKEDFLLLHIKPRHPGGVEDLQLNTVIVCGDPSEPDTMTRDVTGSYVVERFSTIPLPASAVNSRNTLYVQMYNLSEKDSIAFEGDDSFELLYSLGTFHWNTFRALSIIWCRLAFLATLGLMMSSFLSFPVACMPCFLVLFAASARDWLGESLQWTTSGPFQQDSLWVFGPMLRLMAKGFVELVPDFSTFDAVDNVVSGRLVTLYWCLYSLATLVLFQGAVLAIIGCTVLTKRELARETG